ncbi:hypothetical protein M405DRAFT_806156 [Rhizopogon salebrosus TDB-379]|nr:hypothetical protein M405DRAFT_806156 [Rhizopogon salebrosus TDB-379]
MVTTNVETELDIANGARGVVEDVILTRTTAKRHSSHHTASSREPTTTAKEYLSSLSIKDAAHIQHRAG